MKKFSSIIESVNVYGFNKKEYSNIRGLIDSLLHSMYETVTIEGINGKFVKTQSWEDTDRLKSILNYANTNRLLLIELSNLFKLNSYDEIYRFIKDNSKELFLKEGRYFNIVLNKLKLTEEVGVKNEDYAVEFLKNNFKEMNCKPRRTETDFFDDLILGIDIYFTVSGLKNSRDYTVQVKPLITSELINDVYSIKTAGVVKEYKVDYYIFVNRKEKKILMFRNKTTSVSGNLYYFKKEDHVVSIN
jgi:hypothetical protein